MIVFSAIVPHSPLLVPSIGKSEREKLAQTIKAYAELEHALYVAQPETILVISPHAQMYPDSFSGNMHEQFEGGLKEFGDHGVVVKAQVDFLLLDRLQRALRQEKIPFTLTSKKDLDYGSTIPLLLLTKNLPPWKCIPLAPCLMNPQAHYSFGREVARVLQRENRRVAVIASADLSHHLNAQSVEGSLPEGTAFDAAIRSAVSTRHDADLLGLDPTTHERAGQCGYQPILVFMGMIADLHGTMREVCYEAPFGVGCMTALFEQT